MAKQRQYSEEILTAAVKAQQTLPHSIEAEEALLACLLTGGRTAMAQIVSSRLAAECFYKVTHQTIYGALHKAFDAGLDVDEIVVLEQLRAEGMEEDVGGWEELNRIQGRVETSTSVNYWLKLVLGHWKQRQLVRAGREVIEMAMTPGDSFDVVRKSVQEPLTRMGQLSVQEIATDAVDELDGLIERKKLEYAGKAEEVPAEFRVEIGMGGNAAKLGYIDRRKTDNLIVIGAPSSRGKSTLKRQIIDANLRAHPDWNILVFVLEGGGVDYLHYMASGHALVPNRKHHDYISEKQAQGGAVAEKAAKKVKRYFGRLADYKAAINQRLFIFERDRTIDDIVARARELEARLGRIDLIVVDYIQQVQSTKQSANREQQVSEVSNKLQSLQVTMGCPLITGSQLNKDGEARESAAIFNDCTRFWKIDRPKKDMNDNDQSELGRKQYFQTLAQQKFRGGETGQVGYNFNCECGRFLDYGDIPDGERGRPTKARATQGADF